MLPESRKLQFSVLFDFPYSLKCPEDASPTSDVKPTSFSMRQVLRFGFKSGTSEVELAKLCFCGPLRW